MLQCPICQHENPEGAEYCENCGAALAAAPSPSASQSTPAPSASRAAAEPSPAEDVLPEPAVTGSIPADQPAPDVAPPPGPESTASTPETGMQTAPLTGDEPAPDQAAAPAVLTTPAPSVAPSSGQNPRLVAMRHGAPSGQEFPLFGTRLVIGRFDPETGPVDIDLSDTPEAVQISRHHAELFQEDGGWKVRDLGSTNGVFVKSPDAATFGPRIAEPRSLNSGDVIAFGNARFVFQMD